MDRELQLADLETRIYEIKLRSQASETRKKHMNYFLDGIEADSKRLVRSARKTQFVDLVYKVFPTFTKPFHQTISDKVLDNLSSTFSSAKCLYDNLNRFLQAAYLPEEEIERREQKISSSEKGRAEIIGETYNCRRIRQLEDLNDPSVKEILFRLGSLNNLTSEFVSPVRNASEHGHSHTVIERTKKGHVLSKNVSKLGYNVSGILENLQTDYLLWTDTLLGEYLNSHAKEKMALADSLKINAKGFKNRAYWGGGFLAKTLGLYGVAMLSVLLAIHPLQRKPDLQTDYSKHQTYTRAILEDYIEFRSLIKKADQKYDSLIEDKDYLIKQYEIIKSASNIPERFIDLEYMSNVVEKLKGLEREN